jgi:hypothetical protein
MFNSVLTMLTLVPGRGRSGFLPCVSKEAMRISLLLAISLGDVLVLCTHSWHWWLMPVILSTLKADIIKIVVQS